MVRDRAAIVAPYQLRQVAGAVAFGLQVGSQRWVAGKVGRGISGEIPPVGFDEAGLPPAAQQQQRNAGSAVGAGRAQGREGQRPGRRIGEAGSGQRRVRNIDRKGGIEHPAHLRTNAGRLGVVVAGVPVLVQLGRASHELPQKKRLGFATGSAHIYLYGYVPHGVLGGSIAVGFELAGIEQLALGALGGDKIDLLLLGYLIVDGDGPA